MRRRVIPSVLFTAWAAIAQAETPNADQAVAVLQQKCLSCHNEKTALSGLRVDARDALLKGGTRGPALVNGKSADSLLIHAVERTGKLMMPPGPPLTGTEIDTLKRWIDAGAPWPASAEAATPKAPTWWAFQQPVRHPVPALKDPFVKTPVDAFVLAKLKEKKLAPSPEADRRTLVRRAYYDLHGLPPTAEQVQAFVNDKRPDAWERLIDDLLASPRYGEKWGKHWLDLVRYGDTSGFEQDPYQLYAWRYRDYVIKSINEDKPYSRFVQEQIAGDELFPEEPEAIQGTGYFTVGANRDMLFKVEDTNREEQLTDYVDTTSSVFLGLTVGCARCHDHKYDPIPQKDYYRMRAVFVPAVKTRTFLNYNGVRFQDLNDNTNTFKTWEIASQVRSLEAPYRKQYRDEKLAKLPADIRAALETDEEKRTPLQKAMADANAKQLNMPEEELRGALSQADKERLDALERRLLALYRNAGPAPFSPAIQDAGREAERVYLPAKGGHNEELVNAGFLTALGGHDVPEPDPKAISTGRRKALAEWLTKPEHPLTARVMVNRVWQQHFGRGLAASPSDFGLRGNKPSHPELLDWLSSEFVQQGWSLKKLHKLLMTSGVYKQATPPGAAAKETDPENVYLSHFNRRRLEAEEIRDSVLQVVGALNTKMYGRPIVPPLAQEELYGMSQSINNAWVVTGDATEHDRRTIYMISRRTFRMPLLEVFDRPDGVMSCPKRDASTTAPQSLSLFNSGFTVEQAKRLGTKLKGESDPIVAAWRMVLGRDPDAQERTTATEFLRKQRERLKDEPTVLAELGRALLNTNEFLYID